MEPTSRDPGMMKAVSTGGRTFGQQQGPAAPQPTTEFQLGPPLSVVPQDLQGGALEDYRQQYQAFRTGQAAGAKGEIDSFGSEGALQGTRDSEVVDVEEAIDMVGFGSSHVLQYIIIGLFTAADSIEVAFLSYITEVLKEPWGLSDLDEALMESMVFVGQIFGAPFWGKSADNFGRRPVFLVSAALITTCGVATALTNNAISLIIVRFFVGVGVAGLSVPFDIFAEMLPSHLRGKLLLSTFFWFAIGSLFTTFAAWATLCTHGWRWFTIMCALPTGIATIAGIFFLPESAHWLSSTHQRREAARVVNSIAKCNGVSTRFYKLSVTDQLENLRTRDLIRHSSLRVTFFSMATTWWGFGVGFYGISLMLPHLFAADAPELSAQASNSTAANITAANSTAATAAASACGFDFASICKANLGQILGLLFAVAFIDSWGRKPVQQVAYCVSGVMALGLGFPETLGRGTVTMVAAVALAAQMAASCSTWTHTPELFPTNVRGAANALCNSAARTGAAMSTYLIGGAVGVLPTAIGLATVCFVSAASLIFVKETAGHNLDDEEQAESDGESRSEDDGNDSGSE